MNPTELRIGNLVNRSLKSGSGKKIVAPIGCQCIVRIFENTGSFNYEPIPLSAEWFDKFVFKKRIAPDGYFSRFPDNEKSVYEYQYTKEGIIISEYRFQGEEIRYEFIYPNSDPQIYSTLKLDYVHQLQNLFFDLKGKELQTTELG